jgi:hypothetical protein
MQGQRRIQPETQACYSEKNKYLIFDLSRQCAKVDLSGSLRFFCIAGTFTSAPNSLLVTKLSILCQSVTFKRSRRKNSSCEIYKGFFCATDIR